VRQSRIFLSDRERAAIADEQLRVGIIGLLRGDRHGDRPVVSRAAAS
jgi:hypothetical protein